MFRICLAVIIVLTPTLVLAAGVEESEGTAYLNVRTVPDGVEVVVGSEIVGLSPISRLTFPAGEYRVGALFLGRERVERDVILEAGTTTDVRFYSTEGKKERWFSERDGLIGFALVWGIGGLLILRAFATADLG
jgi:hypothetical protein